MSAKVLEALTSEELALSVGFLSTSEALRRFLATTREVAAVRQAFEEGAIIEETVRRFVSDLLADFRRGERFPHEVALAALAVALQRRPTDFSEEFLRDLSQLKLAEMSTCIRVAHECRKRRVSLACAVSKDFNLPTSGESQLFHVKTFVSPLRDRHNDSANTTATCEVT